MDLEETLLAIIPTGTSALTLEELEGKTGRSRGDIHRALTHMCRLDGWSFRPRNKRPYARQLVDGRVFRQFAGSRQKGTPFIRDTHESTWEPTVYEIRRPA